MTIETQSEAEAKRKRAALCLSVCNDISNEHLELILSAGGFNKMATARLVRQVEILSDYLSSLIMSGHLNIRMSKDARKLLDSIESNSPIPESVPDGWQPIKTIPTDKKVLGLVDGKVRLIRWGKTSHLPYFGFCLADQGAEDFDLCSPTHWMPLPEIPKV